MATRARFLFALIVLSSMSWNTRAVAQTISLTTNGFDILRQEVRSSQEFPFRISREDCLRGADVRYDSEIHGDPDESEFTWVELQPSIQNPGNNNNVEVWVSESTDCSTVEARNGNSGNCRLVFSEQNTQTNPTIYVNPRDLVERDQLLAGEDVPALPESICTDTSNQVDLAISIQVMVTSGGENVFDSAEWDQTSLDLQAPPAPDDIDVGPGDQHIFFEWDIDSAAEDPETAGFVFYCVPAQTFVDASMGGADGTGGSDTGGTTTGGDNSTSEDGMGGGPTISDAGREITCDQDVLVAGELATADALEYKCGEVTGRAVRRGQAGNLDNDVTYAVAVAATDVVGNSGELSIIECHTPKEVTTFFEGYKEAGGKGGGGFCQNQPTNGGSLWWLSLLTCAALTAHRRRIRS